MSPSDTNLKENEMFALKFMNEIIVETFQDGELLMYIFFLSLWGSERFFMPKSV